MVEVISFLATLREVHPDMARWGLHGGCFKVYLLLKQRFPNAEPWYDQDHVITRIGAGFYDVTGEVELGHHTPMTQSEQLSAYEWDRLPHMFAAPEGFLMVHRDLLNDLMDQEPLTSGQTSELHNLVEVDHG